VARGEEGEGREGPTLSTAGCPRELLALACLPSVLAPPAQSSYSTFASLPLRASLPGMWSRSPRPGACRSRSALLKVVFLSSGSALFLTGRPRALELQGVHESAPLNLHFP